MENNVKNGETIRRYWEAEVESLLDKYVQFERLIPNTTLKTHPQHEYDFKSGADHKLEDGLSVEALLRNTIRKFIPKNLEVLTGFIVRPAVKTGVNDKSRKGGDDKHSSQLDIIVFDSARYPLFYQSGDTAIVPPEGVIAIISVKKSLSSEYVKQEAKALYSASKLCQKDNIRGPYLALVAMSDASNSEGTPWSTAYNNIASAYTEISKDLNFDDAIGYVGVLPKWSIFKSRPENNKGLFKNEAKYVFFKHERNERHLGLQFIITGILSVYYDQSRNNISRPGYTGFHRKHDGILQPIIQVQALR